MTRATLATIVVALACIPAGARPAGPIALAPCDVGGDAARCGTLAVFENREARAGRTIDLKVIVLDATGTPVGDPIVWLTGGPGSAATESAAGLARRVDLREHHDIVMVDQRGTGASNPLRCRLYDPDDPQQFLGDFLPLDRVRACRAELEATADLRLYTTPVAADDLDDVRAALGYERIIVQGSSYGTRVALVYARRHPSRVGRMVLTGVVPTFYHQPVPYAAESQKALDGLFADCEADAACARAFPDLGEEFAAVLARVTDGPVRAGVVVEGAAAHPLALSLGAFAETVRYMLYTPSDAAQLPAHIHAAFEGDFLPFARQLIARRRGYGSIFDGMFLSVSCSEDIPGRDTAAAKASVGTTFLGDYRVRQQADACELWPAGDLPPDFFAPVRSTAPALVLSGQYDPVTGPRWGDAAARDIANSRHIVVPHGGHGFAGLENARCVNTIVKAFVDGTAPADLDTSCIATIRRRPFPTALDAR